MCIRDRYNTEKYSSSFSGKLESADFVVKRLKYSGRTTHAASPPANNEYKAKSLIAIR